MSLLDERQLLQTVVGLTEKPDIRAFELTLVGTLRELVSAKSVELCRLRENPKAPGRKDVVHVTPAGEETQRTLPLDADPALAECLRTETCIVTDSATPPGKRFVYPLHTATGIVGFLILECEREDAKEQALVSILLRFYRNYVSLLHENQRDKLTGLRNRKTFHEEMLRIIAAQPLPGDAGEEEARHCLAILDIDHFKRVNDQFGHLYGDEVLLLFARAMGEAFRAGDLLFRFGGEEFVVVLKQVDLFQAYAVLERFRQTIEHRPFPQVGTVTVSAGATLIHANDLPATVIDRADQALYYAKANGRNQVYAYEALVAEGKLKKPERTSDVELF